ncbi:hypothetical protein MUK42_34317, partial [Musa troglodytarum]
WLSGIKEQKLIHEGLIVESLSNDILWVHLDNKDVIVCYVLRKICHRSEASSIGEDANIERSKWRWALHASYLPFIELKSLGGSFYTVISLPLIDGLQRQSSGTTSLRPLCKHIYGMRGLGFTQGREGNKAANWLANRARVSKF